MCRRFNADICLNKTRVNKKLAFAGRVLTLLSCLTVSLIGAENATRFFRYTLTVRTAVSCEEIPSAAALCDVFITTGRSGTQQFLIPGPAPAARKADGEFRIALLGGSTIVNCVPTIAEMLKSKLRAVGKNTQKYTIFESYRLSRLKKPQNFSQRYRITTQI